MDARKMGVTKPDELVGKTIVQAGSIHAEYGRTYERYWLLLFADGSRVILAEGCTYQPDPQLRDMREAPWFFTAEEIAEKVLRDEKAGRQRDKERLERKKRELELLKRELGEDA
jgi:hypothetical protein